MKWNERGQVLLAVILIAVVALTIGLSLVSRSITGVRVATQSEESQRAFQAAEAGVERAVNAIQLSPTPPTTLIDSLDNNSEYETNIEIVGGTTEITINGGNQLEQDVGSDVWLSQYPDYSAPRLRANLEVYFGSDTQTQCSGSGAGVTPALEILVLSGAVNNPILSKYIVDPCVTAGSGRIAGADENTGSGGTLDGVSYRYSYVFPINADPLVEGLIARVVPIYNSTIVGMRARSGVFPPQGSIIESTGTAGESVRKIQVYQSHPQIPIELFQYAILSQ